MTLRKMRQKYPGAFHPNQDWFDGEAFMDKEPREDVAWPTRVASLEWVDRGFWADDLRYSAADLAWLWLQDLKRVWNPEGVDFTIWQRYLWTSDTDSQGQRIYVGQNGRGLELHRHLHLTDRFGVPV